MPDRVFKLDFSELVVNVENQKKYLKGTLKVRTIICHLLSSIEIHETELYLESFQEYVIEKKRQMYVLLEVVACKSM